MSLESRTACRCCGYPTCNPVDPDAPCPLCQWHDTAGGDLDAARARFQSLGPEGCGTDSLLAFGARGRLLEDFRLWRGTTCPVQRGELAVAIHREEWLLRHG